MLSSQHWCFHVTVVLKPTQAKDSGGELPPKLCVTPTHVSKEEQGGTTRIPGGFIPSKLQGTKLVQMYLVKELFLINN